MKNFLKITIVALFVLTLSSFTSGISNKSSKRFPVGTTIGYITASGGTLTGSFRVVGEDPNHDNIIYMVSTVTNGYYVVSGTRDPEHNYVQVFYQGYMIYSGSLNTSPGSVPPGGGEF